MRLRPVLLSLSAVAQARTYAHARGSVRARSPQGVRPTTKLRTPLPSMPRGDVGSPQEGSSTRGGRVRQPCRTHERLHAHGTHAGAPLAPPPDALCGSAPGRVQGGGAGAGARGDCWVGAEGRRQRGRRRCADPGRCCGEGAGASDLPEAGASQGARDAERRRRRRRHEQLGRRRDRVRTRRAAQQRRPAPSQTPPGPSRSRCGAAARDPAAS